MNKHRLLTTLLALMLMLAGCGGTPSTPDPDESDPNVLSCSSAVLATNTGQPLDVVSITGISAPADALLAAQITVSNEELGYAFVQLTPDAMTLSVPPHPNGTLEGGQVALSLTDGTTTCEPMLFTIEALPPAPGTMQKAADLMQSALALQAQLLGTSLEELQAASAQELPPHLLPLFSAHLILADSRNPDSVQAMLAGTSPALGDAAEGQDLVDALMAKTEVVALLEERVRQLESELGTLGTSTIRSQAFTYTTKPDAPLLDTYMRLATFGELATDPDAAKYLDAAGTLLAGGAVLAGASGVKKLATLYGEAGGLLFAYQKAAEGFANLLPSEFTTFTFDVTEDVFWEDDDPASGSWENAHVYAKSKGWRLDKLILEMLLNWSGNDASGGVNTHRWMQKFTSNDVALEIVQHTDDFFAGVLTSEIINNAGDGDLVEIEPELFGPTDVSEQEWSERYFLNSGTARFMFIDQHTYEAVDTGIATLEIITEPGKFGYKQIKQQKEIQMLPIEVYVRPARRTVTPGDIVTFEADVQNANDKRVQWSIEPAGVHTLLVTGDNSEFVSVTTSEDPDALPAVLQATSISTSGLRADGLPERSATAMLSQEQIIVKPERPCVIPGGEQQFTAEYPESQQDANVLWEASAGDITQDGLFTAPPTSGTVTVTARDPNDPVLFGEAIVEVGDCGCGWNMGFSGPAGGHEGDFASLHLGPPPHFLFRDDPTVFSGPMIDIQLIDDWTSDGSKTFSLTLSGFGTPNAQEGFFNLVVDEVQYRSGNGGPCCGPTPSETFPPPMELIINVNEPDRISGSVSGVVWAYAPDGGTPLRKESLTLDFRVIPDGQCMIFDPTNP